MAIIGVEWNQSQDIVYRIEFAGYFLILSNGSYYKWDNEWINLGTTLSQELFEEHGMASLRDITPYHLSLLSSPEIIMWSFNDNEKFVDIFRGNIEFPMQYYGELGDGKVFEYDIDLTVFNDFKSINIK